MRNRIFLMAWELTLKQDIITPISGHMFSFPVASNQVQMSNKLIGNWPDIGFNKVSKNFCHPPLPVLHSWSIGNLESVNLAACANRPSSKRLSALLGSWRS